MVPVDYYIILSAILFTIGVLGVLIRRNALIIFMSIELMLNSANLAIVAFSSAIQIFQRTDLRVLRHRRRRGGSGCGAGFDRGDLQVQAQH